MSWINKFKITCIPEAKAFQMFHKIIKNEINLCHETENNKLPVAVIPDAKRKR